MSDWDLLHPNVSQIVEKKVGYRLLFKKINSRNPWWQ